MPSDVAEHTSFVCTENISRIPATGFCMGHTQTLCATVNFLDTLSSVLCKYSVLSVVCQTPTCLDFCSFDNNHLGFVRGCPTCTRIYI